MFIHTYEYREEDIRGITRTWHIAAFRQPKVENVLEIEKWCFNTFGIPYNHLNDQLRWKNNIKYGEIHFDSLDDLLMFVLKWS